MFNTMSIEKNQTIDALKYEINQLVNLKVLNF